MWTVLPQMDIHSSIYRNKFCAILKISIGKQAGVASCGIRHLGLRESLHLYYGVEIYVAGHIAYCLFLRDLTTLQCGVRAQFHGPITVVFIYYFYIGELCHQSWPLATNLTCILFTPFFSYGIIKCRLIMELKLYSRT